MWAGACDRSESVPIERAVTALESFYVPVSRAYPCARDLPMCLRGCARVCVSAQDLLDRVTELKQRWGGDYDAAAKARIKYVHACRCGYASCWIECRCIGMTSPDLGLSIHNSHAVALASSCLPTHPQWHTASGPNRRADQHHCEGKPSPDPLDACTSFPYP